MSKMTATEFDQWADTQTGDAIFEFINGEIVEKMPSNLYSSIIAMRIAGFLFVYLLQNKIYF